MERSLQFAMLADASDEVMAILRFHDRERADTSEIAHVLMLFVRNIMALFFDGKVVNCGMTATMLLHLSNPHTILFNGGKSAKTIGAATG
eukprot:3525039-Lingulodinium_polyedra.AAC.1